MTGHAPIHRVPKSFRQSPHFMVAKDGYEDTLAVVHFGAERVHGNVVSSDLEVAALRVVGWDTSGEITSIGLALRIRSNREGGTDEIPSIDGFHKVITSLGGFSLYNSADFEPGYCYANAAANILVGAGVQPGDMRSQAVYTDAITPITEVAKFEELFGDVLPSALKTYEALHPELPIPATEVDWLENAAVRAHDDPELLPKLRYF